MFPNLGGLFGGGNLAGTKPRQGATRTQSILGTLGDMLSTAGGGQATFLPGLRQRALLEEQRGMQVQQAKTERDNAMQDWVARQQYERANPAPQEPTALQRNYEWLQQTNPSVAQDYLAAQARDPNDETVSVTIPHVGTYVGPRSGMAQAFGGQQGGNRPQIGSTIRLDGGAQPGPQMSAANGPPTPTTTREGLGAMISVHGADRVQQWMQSGQLTIRNN